MIETTDWALKIGLGASGPTICRTDHLPGVENDDVVLVVNLKGRYLIQRASGDVLLAEGDASLVECGEAGAYAMAGRGAQLCVRLERRLLGPVARQVDSVLGVLIPARTEALGLLVNYARSLSRGPWALSPAATRVVADHVCDLVALIVGASYDTPTPARGPGTGRLGAVKAHIRERIDSEDLCAESVAAEQGISKRYLRRLFEAEDQCFSGYVLGQRLANAHAMLSNPRFASQSISQIAFGVGFGDLSYFNRTFRSRYQATPSEVRAKGLRRAAA